MNVCIYGAASNTIDEKYISAVEALGAMLAERGHGLVFGGGSSGLMGAAARGFHRNGGSIIGVAPSFFNVDGVLFPHCTELIYTETMRERKAAMEERADAFVIAPGGIGTYEEFFEVLTLKQLGRHNKPIVLWNIGGYYDPMRALLQHSVREGFFREVNLNLCRFAESAEEIRDYIENYNEAPPDVLFYRGVDGAK